ncbi:uncharacterized protein LOC127568694 [Pristis pectinata]|uniref:uncharacterized protein LOC127568694 n=1 Tax=Pristis pectinata TaxID=685728 RepID=UPI00223DCFDC|nr:uncharacterized protein LOC127568694 [Pristis pectinata]
MEDYERNFEEATLPHFLKGISSVLSVLELVVSAPSDELSNSLCEEIKGKAKVAQREILAAEEAASNIVSLVDTGCEELTSQQGKLSKRQGELQASLASTQEQLADLADQRKQVEGQVQSATAWLRQAKQSLATARAKLGEKQTGRDIGIGLTFVIPCIGIPMAVAFEKERVYRKSEVEAASEELSQVVAGIKRDEEDLARIARQIPELEKEVEKAAETLSGLTGELLQIKQARTSLADTQCKLRNCSHYLSTLHGHMKALEAQSRNLYSLGPLVPLIVATCEQVQQQVPGNEFLLTATQAHMVLHALGNMLPRLKERKQAQA